MKQSYFQLWLVRSSIHSWPGNWTWHDLAIGRAVVYYARLPMHLVQELNVGTVAASINFASCIRMALCHLTLPTLKLFSPKAQWRNDFWKPTKPRCVGIRCIAFADYSYISTHMSRFQSFLHNFVLNKFATSSIRVKCICSTTSPTYTIVL